MATVVLTIAGMTQYDDFNFLKMKVDKFIENISEPLREILTTEDRGVASLGQLYASTINVKSRIFAADWDKEGKSAGFQRNTRLVAASDKIIVFHNGKCNYSKDLIEKALAARKLIKIVQIEPTQQSYTLPEVAT